MAVKAQEVFQGNDWLTYNWSVAQMFDTLDHVLDICNHMPIGDGVIASQSRPASASDDENDVADARDLFACIVELCDDLGGELDAVLADLVSYRTDMMAQRWIGFEMQLCRYATRQRALNEHRLPHPTPTAIPSIMAWALRMRELLRQLDQ